MKIFAVIVAAGTGSRTGRTTPKQFEALAGKPVYRWSADRFAAHERISKIVIVAPPDNCETISSLPGGDHVLVTSGGSTRSASVLNGIAALQADDDDIVLIHDAARPGLSDDVIDALIEALSDFDAAAPALPVSDALKRQESGQLRDVSREALYRVQTPQAFRAGMIRQALANREQDFVDDLAAVEALGARVKLTPGREQLHKITFEDDFALVEKFMAGDAPGTMKIGSGFDVHALVEGDGVTLCGVHIPHSHSLSGHSDADVGWHALTDAIFGALALGDLGDHFPPTDEAWKGADSAVFLQHAIRLASEKGWALSNCDITLICEAPKVKPHRQTMRERTREITGLDIDSISIKATTTEGLGFAGRREGIAAQAVVMLSRSRNS
ncbi:bifunctional 2-C-methyl-D-erythritol 4-phosphate cytidylyltransferase/2-C-methyl-D-erythritol 2,4-cyclodiphosphate synthase [Henriciella sp.]|uniref:bifunctional 2-C-methyl-D-erythritol 4-phosphate cytidylyltransferase/2-C-methyl-D-erythritol 2,4-cyclodiphosphate synthase n=1 Tax=Henriciella sp. TaxID=1968823 RepID=UPI00262DCBC2|nr:bifunctional 2-C-methyl-D-erythritol 4-phosphate cytidylyltransferase/2-C-methyl-D-erythritol 2,4-cyclodiphosphate synthase [Henriciella sp.]